MSHGKSYSALVELLYDIQKGVQSRKQTGHINLDGCSMVLADFVAVAKYGCVPSIDRSDRSFNITESVKILEQKYREGEAIYGINTGFGGNSDVRTSTASMSQALLEPLQSGIVVQEDIDTAIFYKEGRGHHALPIPWTKAMMAIRCNSFLRGHSAIPVNVIDGVLRLLARGITPCVPLRGSISASGDLMPLSYVAGALEGSPTVLVHTKIGMGGAQVESARDALASQEIEPLVLGSRAALALVNGTSASAAVASLAFYEASQLALLSTCLTALISEGMTANVEWSHRFVAEIRPHPGQLEVSQLIRGLLQGSQLVSGNTYDVRATGELVERFDGSLIQDRYPLRTSPQWLGPQFEDLLLAYSQVVVEINSTSDNPSTDPKTGLVYCGGNFQAASMTSATEKMRTSLQMIGKMLFSQVTEMLNYHMSGGLPANLTSDDPNMSSGLKGLDISIAAYQSELSFLANTVSNHVQSAEMHNQAINSLALISGRYTFEAVDLVTMMVANGLYAACQAVDLRVLHATFLMHATKILERECCTTVPLCSGSGNYESAFLKGARAMRQTWWNHSATSFERRSDKAAWSLVLEFLGAPLSTTTPIGGWYQNMESLREVQSQIKVLLLSTWDAFSEEFLRKPSTARYLGQGTCKLYSFVREKLAVPIHRGAQGESGGDREDWQGDKEVKESIGAHVTTIYQAVRDGRLFDSMADTLKAASHD